MTKIQKEREAFEAWLKSLNENGRTTYFLGQESTVAWEAWQASANRQGYKLVPVVDTDAMWSAGRVIIEENGYSADASDVYKAMIGAIE